MMKYTSKYEIKHPKSDKRQDEASIQTALEGLDRIGLVLSEKNKWDELQPLEITRAELSDIGIAHKLGDPGILYCGPNTVDLWKRLEAAIQHAGALNRQQGVFNASVIENDRQLAIVANLSGRIAIRDALRAHKQDPFSLSPN